MRERAVAAQLADKLRDQLPAAVVIKHNDKSTAGLPDLSVTYRGYTSWLELKRLDRAEHILRAKDPLSPVQLATLLQLRPASGYRAWAVAFRHFPREKQQYTEIYDPRLVSPREFEFLDPVAHDVNLGFYFAHALRESPKAVPRVERFNYSAVVQFIIATHTEVWHRG